MNEEDCSKNHKHGCRFQHQEGFENHYKIKLRKAGFRLVYEVLDDEQSVLVIAVGKREDHLVYRQAQKRSKEHK